ncbi:aminoglycoside phosphotransferase family protein [Actinoplanes sp. URMC 104]|uniref:aminoglycoside phosphotransferase family protein n=1 Tax=Actinoplanes sp. URMC 104 TaxID=3423409 RepID=UPI003F1C08D7
MTIERFEADERLVRRLVDSQFPQWAGLALTRVSPGGSDHVIYRLGAELSVRLPRHEGAIRQAAKELRLLPRLAPCLPLAIPEPVAVGEPDLEYPWPWGVSRWLDGSVARYEELGDSVETALRLADFLTALQSADLSGAVDLSSAVEQDEPLADRDEQVRAAIADIAGAFDARALLAIWREAVTAPGWDRPPVWYHGDFHTGNLLTTDGKVSAVIDFGGLGRGDPARDLMMAFTLLEGRARDAFREALAVDDATWARGRGRSLIGGVFAYRAYAATNPWVRAQTTRQLTAVLSA